MSVNIPRQMAAPVIGLAVLLAACGGSNGVANADGTLSVVATTTQVGSIIEEIGGDAVELTVLLQPGIEAHDFEITPAAGAAVEGADLIVKSGAGLESWLDDALETIGGTDRVRDLSEGIDLRAPAVEHADDEDEEADHEDGEVDPHYWMSGPNAIAMVENARDALVDAAPAAEGQIVERATGLIERLGAADGEIRVMIDEIPADRRAIVTDHDALGYFLEEYGLEFVGSVFPNLDVSSEPSAREIEDLVAEIREHGVQAIFTESAVNPQLSQAVAEETDARLVIEPLYTDSLGPEGSGADTLDGMLLHNAQVIRDGLIGD